MTSEKVKNIDQAKQLLNHINETLDRKYRAMDKKKLVVRLKTFHMHEILEAVTNASKDPFHIATNFKHLTFEFFTRNDKIIDKFFNRDTEAEERTTEEVEHDQWIEKHKGVRVGPKVLMSACSEDKGMYVLTKVCEVMSIYPTTKEMKFLSRFIRNEYKELQTAQLIRAFELNSIGRYWTTIQPYGKLTTLFIGNVLKEYQKAREIDQKEKRIQARKASQ